MLLVEDQIVQEEKARAGGDEHGGELRDVAGQLRGQRRVESKQKVGDDPESTALAIAAFSTPCSVNRPICLASWRTWCLKVHSVFHR